MDREFAHFDTLESAIREVGEAELAGVFERTRVDARGLLAQSGSASATRLSWVRRFAAVAAVLVIASSVWTYMFVREFGRLRDRSALSVVSGEGDSSRPAAVSALTGPAVASSQPSADFDADGDLDLADYRTFQLQYSVTR